ncbi:Type-2 restriction enzyme DpnI [subsurface metagenome]
MGTWTDDVWEVIKLLPDSFTLGDIYEERKYLKKHHPHNKHIKAKIRQQLQVLRDKGLIEFKGAGCYRTLKAVLKVPA